jgi:hypothetical protein
MVDTENLYLSWPIIFCHLSVSCVYSLEVHRLQLHELALRVRMKLTERERERERGREKNFVFCDIIVKEEFTTKQGIEILY